MTPAEELAAKVSALLPDRRIRSLKVWGLRFGTRGDREVVKSCYANGACLRFDLACLRLDFEIDKVLAVWNPADVEISERLIRIGSASAIRLSWYGSDPKVPATIRYRDFAFIDGSVAFRTNMDTTPGTGWLEQEIVQSNPAILIGEDH